MTSPNDGDELALHVRMELLPPEEMNEHPCDWCSAYPAHRGLLQERGVVPAKYRLVNHYDVVMGYTCGMCMDGAPLWSEVSPYQ